jgi:hypothetical protein
MSTELEALVGHLFVVGGRALASPSPGAIAMAPPRRSARGRDLDTFFGLVTMAQQPGEPAAFYERMSNLISQQYYTNGGSITAALREAITTANASLLAENMNRDQPAYAGCACAVLRSSEVIIASMGSARAFLLRADMIERLPTDSELREQSLPMGAKESPSIRFYRREVRAGDILFLADASLNELDDGTLRQVTASKDVESSLNNLREMAGEFTTAVVIQFVTPLSAAEEAAQEEATRLAEEEAAAREAVRRAALAARQSSPSPAPATTADVSPPVPTQERREIDAGSFVGNGARSAALGVAKVAEGLRSFVERTIPEGSTGRRELSLTAQMAVAVGIPIIVAVFTTGVYILRGQASQYSGLMSDARSELDLARGAGADQAAARPHWETALFLLDQAEQLRPGEPTVAQLRAEANEAMDFYDAVTRMPVVPLRDYGVGTQLRGPVVQGPDLYLLDLTSNVLYHESLDETGQSVLEREPEAVTRQGELVGDQTVGGLVDLVWMEEGGVAQRNVLAVLTNNGLLLTYSPTWALHATLLPGGADVTDPRAIAVYAGNFYVLDAGANQIWRYEAVGDTYPDLPTPYFTETFPDLTGAVDMDIDANGNIFVLFLDGTLNKYFGGRQEGFEVQGLPLPIAQPSVFFIDQNPFTPAFYIGDPGAERIYQLTTTGVFSRNYKAAEGRMLVALSGIYSDGGTNTVYLTAGNALYRFTRP